MGGRGTFASGKNVAYTYDKVGEIEGVKVLFGKEGTGLHDLPAESHSSNMYRYFLQRSRQLPNVSSRLKMRRSGTEKLFGRQKMKSNGWMNDKNRILSAMQKIRLHV